MKRDFFALYEALAAGLDSDAPVTATTAGERWSMTETAEGLGLGMATPGQSIPARFPDGLVGLPLRQAACAASSWNLEEAAFGLAAANAFYNTPARLESLNAWLPFEKYYTEGIDLRDRTVGIVGHMHGPPGLREQARAVYVLERAPQAGDYPDAACDVLLPQCDLVLITGSSLINKTLPHLLELCEGAITVLTGPSVPMCPALLELGIDRLAGLVVTDRTGMAAHVRENRRGNPYVYGKSFLLERKG